MKRILALVAATLLAFAAVPVAAAQTSFVRTELPSTVSPASLDLPRASYAAVDRPLLADAERASLPRIPMPRAARDGAIGGAVAGAVLGASFGYIMGGVCQSGLCYPPEERILVGGLYGAVAGAVVGYVAGRVWHAARD